MFGNYSLKTKKNNYSYDYLPWCLFPFQALLVPGNFPPISRNNTTPNHVLYYQMAYQNFPATANAEGHSRYSVTIYYTKKNSE